MVHGADFMAAVYLVRGLGGEQGTAEFGGCCGVFWFGAGAVDVGRVWAASVPIPY